MAALVLGTLLGATPVLAQAPAPQQKAPAQQAPAQQTQPSAQAPAPPAAGAPAAPSVAPQGAEGAAPPAQPPPPAAPPAPVLSAAEQREIEEIQKPIAEVKAEIERLEKAVERNLENEEELTRLRGALIETFLKTRATREALKPKAEALRQQIEQLGPAPAADAPESAEVAGERARLNALRAEVDGALKNTELLSVRMRQLRDTVQTARQTLFTSNLFKLSPSPLSPETWLALVEDVPGAFRQVRETLSSWFSLLSRKWVAATGLIAGVIVLYVLLVALVRWFLAYRLDRPREEPPTFFVRAATIGWVAPLFAVPALAALGLLGGGLDYFNLTTYEISRIADAAFPALFILVGVAALTRAILQPRRPVWRLVDLSTPAARTVARIITLIAAVFATDIILQEAIRRLFLPFSVNIMETALASIAIGVLMLRLVQTPFEPKSVTTGVQHDGAAVGLSATRSRFRPYLIKLPLLAVATAILVVSLLGYVGLGRFITQQVIFTGSVVAVILIFHLAIRALLGAPGSGIKPFAAVLEETAGLAPVQAGFLAHALSVLLNLALAVVAFPIVLMTWRYTGQEALYLMRSAVFGFQIGDFRISLARIMIAVALFFALLFATRLAQRWIDHGVSRSKRIDPGIANSIHTAIGYTGFIVAGLAAISYGGIDITSFAIVAGALSVGIGFGLQSIINNFVSGLILLVERPIKVGDRVTVNGEVGFVRRISVRSTEIETFDRTSLIVPNSEFITTTVTNWTHRNALGRAVINVRVSYSADPEQVRDILYKVADECSFLQKHPPPWVGFMNFGDNGMEFLLVGILSDVNTIGDAQSDLRYRLIRAFRQSGIEIAHPQRDIHLRDLDGVRTLLSRLAEERAREAGVTVTGSEADKDTAKA